MVFVKLNDGNIFIHYMPFHEKYGLGKTKEELEQEGILVENIPEPEEIDGKIAVLKWDGEKLYYEYIDKPLTDQERIALLEQAILELTMLLGGGN